MHGRARSHVRAWSWIFVALLLLSSGVLLAQPASLDDGPAARQFASCLARRSLARRPAAVRILGARTHSTIGS